VYHEKHFKEKQSIRHDSSSPVVQRMLALFNIEISWIVIYIIPNPIECCQTMWASGPCDL
jgi:hypothetical protein